MALANVLGFSSNEALNRSLQPEKIDQTIEEFAPKLNIENIAQFITLPPYADVNERKTSSFSENDGFFCSFHLASEIFENGQ